MASWITNPRPFDLAEKALDQDPSLVRYAGHLGMLVVPPGLEQLALQLVYSDELKILDLTLAALEDAIEEAGNTRRGRALKRQAKKIRSAIRSRGGKA